MSKIGVGKAMNDSKKTKNQLVSELDELRHSEERLSLALEAAHMARWEWDLQSGEIIWSDNLNRCWAWPPAPSRAAGRPSSSASTPKTGNR